MFRFLIVFLSLSFISSHVYANNTPCTDHQCIAVVDAGSTGSRLHIYEYDTDETNTPTHINEIWDKKVSPGFATIDSTYSAIAPYLTTLLTDAPKQAMPVYFYATGGMRFLPPWKQKRYYDILKRWFSEKSQWQLKEAKTLTGNEEAVFDWLSVNYHLGNFNSGNNKSVGVMDMGGASVQIAFPINPGATDDPSNIQLNLYGQHFTLSVHSYLGLGRTEMSHQFLNVSSCFANNFPLPDGKIGQGNALQCEQEIALLLNKVQSVSREIQPILSANPVDTWYTIGGLSYLADNALFNFENNQLTNQSLLQQADQQVCQQQWSDLSNQFPEDDYIYEYCLFPAYYYALMVDGYGIYPEQIVNYIPPTQNLDWTIGVVLKTNSPGKGV